MSRIHIIHNLETGEIIERPYTADEEKQADLDAAQMDQEKNLAAQRKIEKQQLLERLGMTDEEAKLLLS